MVMSRKKYKCCYTFTKKFKKISFVTQSTAVPKGNVAKEVQVLSENFLYPKNATVSLLKIEA